MAWQQVSNNCISFFFFYQELCGLNMQRNMIGNLVVNGFSQSHQQLVYSCSFYPKLFFPSYFYFFNRSMKNETLTRQFDQIFDDRLNFSASLKAAGSDSVVPWCIFPSSCLLITVANFLSSVVTGPSKKKRKMI